MMGDIFWEFPNFFIYFHNDAMSAPLRYVKNEQL